MRSFLCWTYRGSNLEWPTIASDGNEFSSYVVPGAGLEPAWSLLRGILSPLRLPVSPPGRIASVLFVTRY